MPTVHQYQWYHGTLDRNESNQLIIQYTNNMPEQEQSEVLTDDSLEEGDVSGGCCAIRLASAAMYFDRRLTAKFSILFFRKHRVHF